MVGAQVDAVRVAEGVDEMLHNRRVDPLAAAALVPGAALAANPLAVPPVPLVSGAPGGAPNLGGLAGALGGLRAPVLFRFFAFL